MELLCNLGREGGGWTVMRGTPGGRGQGAG